MKLSVTNQRSPKCLSKYNLSGKCTMSSNWVFILKVIGFISFYVCFNVVIKCRIFLESVTVGSFYFPKFDKFACLEKHFFLLIFITLV
jgi:hypothetical protein